MYLVAIIDDATSRAYAFRAARQHIRESASAVGVSGTLGETIGVLHGQEQTVYGERAPPKTADEPVKEEVTQIGRALRELGIGWIAARSPQAKGRIERFVSTAIVSSGFSGSGH